MMRLTNQRGVSLMLLIIMITIFAGVAIGIVTLLRTRHESYPYQVQPYQALALADAGVQFATRYVLDNQFDFSLNPSKYILPPSDPNPTKNTYSLGNGQFQLRYEPATTCTPGQMGNLYCKGMVGTATREVKITDFGALIDMVNGNALLRNPSYAPTQWKLLNDWGGPMSFPVPIYFNGWTVAFYMCGIWMYGGQGNGYVPVNWVRPENQPPPVGDGSGTLSPSFTVAVSYPPGHPCQVNPPQSGTPCANPLKLGRLVVGSFDAVNADPAFV